MIENLLFISLYFSALLEYPQNFYIRDVSWTRWIGRMDHLDIKNIELGFNENSHI